MPDESMPGFILRLAHRLDRSPGEIIRRTGLTTGHRANGTIAPAGHLLMLEESRLLAFCTATRVGSDAAQALTFSPLVDRHPAVRRALRGGHQAVGLRPRAVFPHWILAFYSRYCPRCLAGDGSAIQAEHGGPWKRQWRLGITFACLEHGVLLKDSCPACGLLAFSGYPAAPLRLLPTPARRGLHPAQCRNTPTGAPHQDSCGHRLDANATGPALTPALVRLQADLLALLTPRTDSRTAFEYLADLQVAATIVQATWPAAADAVPAEVAGALDDHIGRLDHIADKPDRGRTAAIAWSAPPTSVPATAALLFAAAHLATLPAPELLATLSALLNGAPALEGQRWGDIRRTITYDCSDTFRTQLHGVVNPLPAAHAARKLAAAQRPDPGAHWQDSAATSLIPVCWRGYGPEHIPQEIPESWFAVFTGEELPPRSRTRMLQRQVAVQLIQAATGLGFEEAAEYLGIPRSWIAREPRRLATLSASWRWRAFDFPSALTRLASHIASQTKKTDYHARRTVFRSWELDEETWTSLNHLHKGLRSPAWRQRDCASAFVWSRITGSEYRLAPPFNTGEASTERRLHSESPELQMLTFWESSRANPNSRCSGLISALEAHARTLADKI
ncbi:TniQ family protein [Kitasatospora sp. NPDC058406]|uniref:TniQ family protein n=1 Tax=Kitasatospora sp. NPDC058406 TaxID=3346483 RepID=UPI00364D57F1